MRFRSAMLAAALAVGLLNGLAIAAPTVPNPSSQAQTSADIPFDPPLESKLRYRWEKTEQRDGKSEMAWSVDDFQFEQVDDGYRLTVTPVSSGSNETDPAKLAIMKRLEELTRRPFVLRLNADGQIEQLEDADFYWSTINQVFRDEIARLTKAEKDPAFREVMENVRGMFERMPAETRLTLLTESIHPALEFANTHTEVGKPIKSTVESPSAYGGTINREVTISLNRVADATAYLTIGSTVPRAELDKLMQLFLKQLTALPADKRSEAEQAMASFDKFRHDTLSDYQVSVEDGLLERFNSRETVEVAVGKETSTKITTRSLTRID